VTCGFPASDDGPRRNGRRTGIASRSDKDEVGGSSPPRPTIRPLTSGNAAQPLKLSRLLLISKESTRVGPLQQPHGSLTSTFAGHWLTSGTPHSVAQRSYSALLRVLTSTRPGEQPESRDARVGAANVMTPNWPHSVRRIRCHAEKSSKGRGGSLLVEAEAVSDRGRFPATGDPQLGEDPQDVDASRLGGNEQVWPICRLVWPSATSTSTSSSRWVRPSETAAEEGAVGAAGVSTGCSRRRRPRFGEQLDLPPQRCRPKRNHHLVGWAEHALGLCMHWPAGQQCFGLAETCVSGLEGIGQPLPGHRSRPPPRVGPSLQPRLLGPGKQRATEPSRSAGATRCPGCWQGSARR
jgi:hypothetical protein